MIWNKCIKYIQFSHTVISNYLPHHGLQHSDSLVQSNAQCFLEFLSKLQCFLEFLYIPLDCKLIQPVHSEGDQPWDFFESTGAKAETPVLRPPHAKNWLIGKDSDAWRNWGQEEKGTTEDEMAGWHHWLDGRKSEWILGVFLMDSEAWLAVIHAVATSWTWLSNWTNWTELVFIMPSNNTPSVVPFSSSLQSFPAAQSSQMSWFFTSGGHILQLQLHY